MQRLATTALLFVLAVGLMAAGIWVVVYHDDVIWMAIAVVAVIGTVAGLMGACWTVAGEISEYRRSR